MLSTYNVFEAARLLGLRRVVWASSETILGLPFEREQPAYAPIDEEHPAYPESSYALSKLLAEELGRQLYRWSGTPFVALRFSNIMEPEDYERFPSFWSDATLRRWNLWGYVDARDVAQSCRLALNADVGAEHFIVAAADTVMNRPSRELMAEVYPSVPCRPTTGDFDTLLSIEKARKLLGYEPAWSWRDHIADREPIELPKGGPARETRAGPGLVAVSGLADQQPGSLKLAMRVCQPAVLDAWPAAV